MATPKINIVFIGGFTYPSGMAGTKRVQHIIDYFFNNNDSVKVLIVRQQTAHKSLDFGFFKGVFYTVLGNNLSFFKLLLFPLIYLKGIKLLFQWKSNLNINVLYVYNGINIENIPLVLFARLIRYKVVVDIVEDYSFHLEKISFFQKIKLKSDAVFEKHISVFVNGIIGISTFLVEKFKYGGHDIPVFHLPITAKENNYVKRKNSNSKIRFAYTGSYGNKDGVIYLVKAFNNLSKKYPNIELVMTGSDKSAKLALDGINNSHINFTGFLEEDKFFDFIANADILCMTRVGSQYANAGFPFKLGEYLATGNPVIASNVSDISKYLDNGKDALIVSPENVSEIESAMEFLILNPEEGNVIGKNGKNKWRKHFNPDVNIPRFREFLMSL